MQLEDRKLKEIEHSDRRRSIVKSFEYYTDFPKMSMLRQLFQMRRHTKNILAI